ncbi:phage scaffolding protein [Vagococcus elongatus]|uniref:Capsid protein n=1 Tax=Vagococcus elongatus TaxID=180344 RepID=A0A430AU46_9ENTE|nr:phage scaffolding protein [Vagococcus elongatus]RSU11575.1 capsid protein [Vagococcus elongatus]
MKREELKELGLTDEQLESVIALHGKTTNDLKTQVNELEGERNRYKEQLDANQAELDTLKEKAEGNEELTTQLAELQTKYNEAETEAETKLANQKKDFAIRLALKEANPADEDIVLNLLNQETIQVTDKGLLGLEEQLKTLQEEKAFLFQQNEPQNTDPKPQIFTPGNPNGGDDKPLDPFEAKLAKYN